MSRRPAICSLATPGSSPASRDQLPVIPGPDPVIPANAGISVRAGRGHAPSARANLYRLIDQVNRESEPLTITTSEATLC